MWPIKITKQRKNLKGNQKERQIRDKETMTLMRDAGNSHQQFKWEDRTSSKN